MTFGGPPTSTRPGRARMATGLAALMSIAVAGCQGESAKKGGGSFPGANAVAASYVPEREWEGPVVEWPAERPRPDDTELAARSRRYPLAVHADPRVPESRIAAALDALETAHEILQRRGWAAPWPDGGRAATPGLDLYLRYGVTPAARAFSDGPVPAAPYDAASAWAAVDAYVSEDALDACVTSAYMQALLFGQDPAEAASWRRATGAWGAWLVTGRFGCANAAVRQQRQPWRSWIRNGAHRGAGGGLLLALISARHDGGSGRFIRDAWQLARQHSGRLPGNGMLRGGPDLWAALERTIELAGVDMETEMQRLAVARWFAGDAGREQAAPLAPTRTLPPEATPPVSWEAQWRDLPVHTPPTDPALQAYGSAYARVGVSEAPAGSVLRVWLRGEYGVHWALTAVRLGSNGAIQGRATAASRERPHSYVPVELLDDTERVLVVATNMSRRLPDADVRDENVRAARLIFDKGR